MAQFDHVLQAFTVFTNGFGKAGSGEKCNLPKLEKHTEMFRGGGMRMGRTVALGYKEIKFDADFSSFDPQVMALGGLSVGRSTQFSVTALLDGDRNQQVKANLQMRGEIVKLDPGMWDAGKKAMLKMEASLVAVRLRIGSALVWDIDIENDVIVINGVDEMAALLSALA
jgi:hypothetical protein